MNNPDFISLTKVLIREIEEHKIKSQAIEDEAIINIVLSNHDKVLEHLNEVLDSICEKKITTHYLNQLQQDIFNLLNYFAFLHRPFDKDASTDIEELIKNYFNFNKSLQDNLEKASFNLAFFKKLGFFSENIVIVGANGSGKTTLSKSLKQYLPGSGVFVSAQKIMVIPTFSAIANYDLTNQKLQNAQTTDKSLKITYSTENSSGVYHVLSNLGDEFQILLASLFAERNQVRNQFCDSLAEGTSNLKTPPITKLDIAIRIWNSLISHRLMKCADGYSLTISDRANTYSYPAHEMSDGEKVVLFLVSQVLLAPNSSFIVIDEPEMYLHKTILQMLWDTLEKERSDCLFIYLTHDLDFATSRVEAKKVWIKSYDYPTNNWEMEELPQNDLPEPLLLKLLGSRRNVLFCESEIGKTDEQVYKLLFPNFLIIPVSSCSEVINYTKAFNKIKFSNYKAFGIIDCDYHDEARVLKLKSENIYTLDVAEIENLFLDAGFLSLLIDTLLATCTVEGIKSEVLSKLEDEIELQVSNYVAAKINYYFDESHVTRGNTLESVKQNFDVFTNEIKINEWYEERKRFLTNIVRTNNYSQAIKIYNNKGLKKIIEKNLNISKSTERAILLLKNNKDAHNMLLRYFPQELVSLQNNN